MTRICVVFEITQILSLQHDAFRSLFPLILEDKSTTYSPRHEWTLYGRLLANFQPTFGKQRQNNVQITYTSRCQRINLFSISIAR